MEEIYLDNSATTRPRQEVLSLMHDIEVTHYGNPSSLHRKGLEAERLLDQARARIAAVLETRPDEICFTSGGTEAINMAIRGSAYRHRRRGNHLVTTTVEHPAVLNCCRRLEQEGFTVTFLPVGRRGRLDPETLAGAITPGTVLVSVIHVNNEIGTVNPVERIGTLVKQCNPRTLFHIDGVQSFGRLPVRPATWQADLFSCSAHKIHGPKGVGALWVRSGTLLQPLLEGGDQEKNLRPGTENVAGAAGFGLAAEMTRDGLAAKAAHMGSLKQMLFHGLCRAQTGAVLNGPPLEEGAPHIINLSFPGVKAEVLLHALEEHGIYTSPGSACHSRRAAPSHVLHALALEPELIAGALRFSFSAFNTAAEIETVIRQTAAAVRELQTLSEQNRSG